jgi:CHAT domain-containing protein
VRAAPTRLVHVDLGPAASLAAAIEAFLEQAIVVRGTRPAEKAARSPGALVRERLWDPLRPHIGAAELVVVCPETFLATLPLGVLQDVDDTFLLEKHAFIHLQEVATLPGGHAPRGAIAPSLLAMGAVDYFGRLPPATARPKGPASANWPPLSETRREVDSIEDLFRSTFGRDAVGQVLRDEEATEERLKREMGKATIVHLATHGFFHASGAESISGASRTQEEEQRGLFDERARALTAQLPGLLSGLVCAGANVPVEAGSEDGRLTAEEVAWLDLSACELVVLSACQTGLGRAQSGEGLMSLQRAFARAGARLVISSLWRVRDDATRDLMVDFYGRLWQQQQSALEALRGAQLAMLKRNRERFGDAMPSTWGAFVASGAWQ